jgi:hypothetical protein
VAALHKERELLSEQMMSAESKSYIAIHTLESTLEVMISASIGAPFAQEGGLLGNRIWPYIDLWHSLKYANWEASRRDFSNPKP